MKNHHIPEEVMWKEQEAYNTVQAIIEKIKLDVQWEAEEIEYIHALAIQEAFNLNQDPNIQSFPEANICIKIAKWRAKNLIEKQEYEDLRMDAYIQLRDMISQIKLENGLLIDPRAERRIIDHYNRPRGLRNKFRSQILDLMLRVSVIIAQDEDLAFSRFRKKIFPYLPPYDVNPE